LHMAVKPALEAAPTQSLHSTGEEHDSQAPVSEGVFTAPFGNYNYSPSPLRRRQVDDDDGARWSAVAGHGRTGLPHQSNNTGLPDQLKSGVENLSGLSLDNVKVHYNSPQPVQLNALAYTQGTEIHVAPGQERHLPHEAWHVVQQALGRVRPTTAVGDVGVNDEAGLENEADRRGATLSAMLPVPARATVRPQTTLSQIPRNRARPVQRVINFPDKVEKQYTKNTYLTKLWKAARKTSADISFDQVRQAWIEAEASDDVVDLPDDIDRAWAGIAPFLEEETEELRPTLDAEAELAALNEAGLRIPMTERAGLDKHRASVRSNVGVIFPAARAEEDEEQRKWDPGNPAEFEEKLPTVDYATWDNLLDRQKRFLLENQGNIKVLMGALQAEVGFGNSRLREQAKLPPGKRQSKTYSDYIVALFSHLAVSTANPEQVAKEAGIADGGKYLSAVFNVRRGGQDKSITAYKAAKKTETRAEKAAITKGQPPIDWLNEVGLEEMLREDAPFLRQRAKQVTHLKKNINEFDILKKWASGGSNVQSHNSNMDSDVLATIATTASAKDKQSPIANIGLLDSLLAKITPVEGTLYGAYPRNDSLRVGYLFSQGTPMSASESAGGTVAFSKNTEGGADRYKIYATGHNGIPISAVVPGVGQGQREILFRAQATFKVLSIEEGDFGANVTRQITMVEQGAAISRRQAGRHDDKAVTTSQEALLNERDKWITKFSELEVDAETQAWFISNNTGDRIEGQADASFAFPYGKKTAQAWHDVITNDDIDIWSIEGFTQVAARLLGSSPAEIKFIVDGEDPGSWGEALELPDKDKTALIGNGLLVEDLYAVNGDLSQELFAQIAARAGAEFSDDDDLFRLRLTAKQRKLITGRWRATKEKGSEKDGTDLYKISQLPSRQKSGKRIKADMEAAGQMKALLVSLAGGSADGTQVPLSAAAAGKIQKSQKDTIEKTKKSKVGYQNEDKRSALERILARGAEGMEAINALADKGSRKEGGQLTESAKLAARIQQQLSVLHPLHDGNGRISRAYAYLVLRRLGFGDIPLPLFDQDRDQSTEAEEWENQFAAQAAGGVKEKEDDSDLVEEIPVIASEADALKFMQVHAGAKTKEAIESVNAEQIKIGLGGAIQMEDMWLVDEMLKYIGQRPEWLSKELRKDMDDLRRKRDTESTTNTDVFQQTLALKKQLVLEITEKMREAPDSSIGTSGKPGGRSESLTPDSPGKKKDDASGSQAKGENTSSDFVQRSSLGNPDFAARLNLQMQSAAAAVALGGQDQLADDVLNRYDETNHGVQAHLIAYMVLMNRPRLTALDRVPADTVYERLNTVVIPSARMFFTWEEEVEQAELRWVQSRGLGAGVLWQDEMNYRTRLARAWVARNPDYEARVDAAQRAIVRDALDAAESAQLQDAEITAINRSFVNGAQLTDGNCLFAALAAPDNVNLESADTIRANVVAGLLDADVVNTPLAELRQLSGTSAAARQARLAYDAMRDQGISLARYRQYMAISGVWGGDPEIQAWTRLNPGQTVYLLEPGNVLFRGISNAIAIGTQTADQVLAAVNLRTAVAIRNTGGHYIRLLPQPQPQQPAALQDGANAKGSGPARKRKGHKPLKSIGSDSDSGTDNSKRARKKKRTGKVESIPASERTKRKRQGNGSKSSGSDAEDSRVDSKKRERLPGKKSNPGGLAKKARKEVFACQEKDCGKTFVSQGNLARHMRNKHFS
jgi:prophage maintenance system killer protein